MKAITLTQPWATLVAIGAKQIETRSWATRYRGPLAIHAAAGLGPVGGKSGLAFQCCCEPFLSALRAAGIKHHNDLPFGAIVATCELVEVYQIPIHQPLTGFYADDSSRCWNLTEQERAFGDYTPGRYAWLLANVQRLPEPIPARGQLGLWNWEGSL